MGFNHALAGGLIAKYLPLPVALPLALGSHFLLDTLPHYGIPHADRDKSPLWKVVFIADFFATLGLWYIPIHYHHLAWGWGGLAAVLPDFIWVGRVIRTRSFDLSNNQSWFTKWHARIQGYERPWGIWVELPVAAFLFYLVLP